MAGAIFEMPYALLTRCKATSDEAEKRRPCNAQCRGEQRIFVHRRRIAPPRHLEALHWLESTLDWLNRWAEADDLAEMQPDRAEHDAGCVAGMDIEGPPKAW